MIINETEYSEKILERFSMNQSKAQSTPIVTRQVKNRENRDSEKIKESEEPCRAPYRKAIGSLMYLAGATNWD